MSPAMVARGVPILCFALLGAGAAFQVAARAVSGPPEGSAPFASPWVGDLSLDRRTALGSLGPIARSLLEAGAEEALVVGDFSSDAIRERFPPLGMATWPLRYAPMDVRYLPSVEEVRFLIGQATKERPLFVVVLGDPERDLPEKAAALAVLEVIVKTESARLLRGGPR